MTLPASPPPPGPRHVRGGRPIDLVYVCLGFDAAFDSQVGELLKAHARAPDDVRIHLLMGTKPEHRDRTFDLPGVETTRFRRYPEYPLVGSATVATLARVLRRLRLGDRVVAHTRGEVTGYLTARALRLAGLGRCPLVVDVRGAYLEEVEDFLAMPRWLKRVKLAFLRGAMRIFRTADAVSAVSPALKAYLVDRYAAAPAKIHVHPSIAGRAFGPDPVAREAVRRDLGLFGDDRVAVFATGGGYRWQEADYIVRMVADKGIKVLMLAQQAIDHPNVIARYVPYGDMPRYLAAADLAVIWRKPHVINHVASPIKFSEYVAAGLPVVANDAVDSIARLIRAHGCGRLVSRVELLDRALVEELAGLDRAAIARLGQQTFGADPVGRSYRSLYGSVLGDVAPGAGEERPACAG